MKRIKIVGCLAVALALSGFLTTSALAGQHHRTKGELFSNWVSGVTVLEVEKTAKLECKTSKTDVMFGEEFNVFTSTEVAVNVIFEGCEMAAKKCHSTLWGSTKPAPEGTIVTNLLRGFMGYVNAARGEVGIDFVPNNQPSEGLYNFDCPGAPDIYVKVKGSVIGRIGPVNVTTTASKLVLNESLGAQEVERLESGCDEFSSDRCGVKDTLVAEVSSTGETGRFETLAAAQSVTATLENRPQEVVKHKKTETFADPSEVKTGGTSGSPEYGRCRGKKNGRYTEGNCNTVAKGKHKGKFEFFPVPN
jgi:hypothetical protein